MSGPYGVGRWAAPTFFPVLFFLFEGDGCVGRAALGPPELATLYRLGGGDYSGTFFNNAIFNGEWREGGHESLRR